MDNFSAAHAFGTSPPLHVLLFSTLPVVIGGVLNLAFIKSALLDGLRRPIDGGRPWKDGGPVFGPNKTWKGLLGCMFRGTEGAVFRLVDQVDSILGCCIVMLAYSQITLSRVALLLLFGAFIHWGVSGLLHVAGLR